MLRRTRVSRQPDIQRMGAALARPGMDTRVWVELGFVISLTVADDGAYADVSLANTGDTLTCYLGEPYAGQGYGAYFPVAVDDTVLVAVPNGEPDNGPVIMARLWSASDSPPPEAVASPQDVVLRARSGQNIQLLTAAPGLVLVNNDLLIDHLYSASDAPPTSSDPAHLAIDSTSTDENGTFTLQNFSAQPPSDKAIGIDVTYNRPYKSRTRVYLTPADDLAGKLGAPDLNVGGPGADFATSVIYISAQTKDKFTVQNRTGVGGDPGTPTLNSTWNYRVVGVR